MLAWDQLRPVVLGQIEGSEVTASDLKAALAARGIVLSQLAFRGMMANLERAGLVAGRLGLNGERGDAEGRRFRLTVAGRTELLAAQASPGLGRDAA